MCNVNEEIKNAAKEIESHSFAVRMNLASNIDSLIDSINAEPSVKLISENINDTENLEYIFRKAINISKLEIDLRYENPFDIALVSYLAILHTTNIVLCKFASRIILVDVKNCWWAKKLAHLILLDSVYVTNNIRTDDQNIGEKINVLNNVHTLDAPITVNFLTPNARLTDYSTGTTLLSESDSWQIETPQLEIS